MVSPVENKDRILPTKASDVHSFTADAARPGLPRASRVAPGISVTEA
jgi:hypothetical protein